MCVSPFLNNFLRDVVSAVTCMLVTAKKGKYHLEILEYKDSYQVLKRKQLEREKYRNVFTDNFASIRYYIRAE